MVGDGSGQLNIFNEDSLNLTNITSFQAHSARIWRIKQSPFNNSFYIATSSSDKTVKIWNPSYTTWNLIQIYANHSNFVIGLEWINENTIASGSSDHTIQVWSIFTGQNKLTLNTGYSVISLALLNNEIHLAAGGSFNQIKVYNIKDGTLISTLNGHNANSAVLEIFSINNFTLISSSNDYSIRIWDLSSYTSKFKLNNHTSTAYALKKINIEIFASGSMDTAIKLWNVTSGELIRTLTGHNDGFYWSLDLLDDEGQILVSGSQDQTIKLWDWMTGKCLNTIYTGINIMTLARIKGKLISIYLLVNVSVIVRNTKHF